MSFLEEFVGFEPSPDYDVKVNAIVDFWSNPCNAPWTVYVETLYPALGRMFIALVDTSLLDIARSYLRPRQGLTRGHNRKKGRRRGKSVGIPDTADVFARMIPGASIWEGMEYGANTKFLWQIDGIIQRGLWYWLLIDATADGLYWWAQGIQEERFCQPTKKPGIFLTNPDVYATAFFGQWYPSPGWVTQWAEPGFDWTFTAITVPEGDWIFTYFATYTNEWDAWGTVWVRLTGTGIHGQASVIVPPRATRDLTFSVHLKGPLSVPLEQRVTGTPFINGGPGIISVTEG